MESVLKSIKVKFVCCESSLNIWKLAKHEYEDINWYNENLA